MHERTQRAIARLLFVFCCAVPTALTLLCVLVTWTPWYHHRVLRAIENEVSRESGLIVRIDDFRRYAPSTVQLSGVRVVHPETLREVARVREVRWIRQDNQVSISLQQPELQSSQLESAWCLLHDRFLCRPERTSVPVGLAANDLTIHSRSGAITLRGVDASLRQDGQTVVATVQCTPANYHSDAAVTITASRDRSTDIPSTRWRLDTGGTPLPCSALAEYLPILESLGSRAEFQGTMQWQANANHWMIDLGGARFDKVVLDRLFEQQSHRLSGDATIQFDRCRIEPQRRRSDIVGSIRAKHGQIGRSLLLSAQQHLGCEARFPEGVGDVPFDLIAIEFNINNTQLTLNGICRTEPGFENHDAGVVMCMDGYPLVRSSGQQLDALAVATAIAPSHSVMVPLSNQTDWLTYVLVPPSRPLPGGENRIRSAQRWQGGPTIAQPVTDVRSQQPGARY